MNGVCSGGDDAAYLGDLLLFDVRPHQGFCKVIALAAAGAHVELLSNVSQGSGAFIKRTSNRFVGDVMAYAKEHGDSPPG